MLKTDYIYSNDGMLRKLELDASGDKSIQSVEYLSGKIQLKESDKVKWQYLHSETGEQFNFSYINLRTIRENGKLKSLSIHDKCNDLADRYEFDYDTSGVIQSLTEIREKVNKKISDMVVTYNAKGLGEILETRVNSKGALAACKVIRDDKGQVSRVDFYRWDKIAEQYVYEYDQHGRIAKQYLDTYNDKGERKRWKEFTITYEELPGNDDFIWNHNHWKLNYILGVRTFAGIEFPCY